MGKSRVRRIGMPSAIRDRHLESTIRDSLSSFRVVMIQGARQTGKTTLARRLGASGTFLGLDDNDLLRIARDDPVGLIAERRRPVVIDEVQRAGDSLVRAIKMAVDRDPTPGGFLLTGSADFLTVPGISESLAGRVAIFELSPFSQGEIEGHEERFLDRVFTEPDSLRSVPASGIAGSGYSLRICAGGYPEPLAMEQRNRRRWFDAYVNTTVSRDVAEFTGARRTREIPRLLRALAARTANQLVVSSIHDQIGLGRINTTSDYLAYLEMIHLVTTLPTWSANLGIRVKRHPKVYITDTGLAAALLGRTPESLARPTDPARGQTFETFVVNELRRQSGWSDLGVDLFQYRDRYGHEIDLICEAPDGRVVGIEVKASATTRPGHATHLAWLRDRLGDRFIAGIVLYAGALSLPLGDRITAHPLSILWEA